jgi:hypothetical protein
MKLQNVCCQTIIKMASVTAKTTIQDAIMMVEIVVDVQERLYQENVQYVFVMILITIPIVSTENHFITQMNSGYIWWCRFGNVCVK